MAYYQQVGRAGRAVEVADGILLSGREDDDIVRYFIDSAFPPEAEMRQVLDALRTVDTASVPELERHLNLSRTRIAAILKLLEVDGAVARSGSRFNATLMGWDPDTERIERVTALRRAELEQMRAYTTHEGCLMAFLVAALDGPDIEPCGRCTNCRGRPSVCDFDEDVVRAAIRFLRRSSRPIPPRRLWPQGAIEGRSGKIAPSNEEGLALSIYGDAGWGVRGRTREIRAGSHPR